VAIVTAGSPDHQKPDGHEPAEYAVLCSAGLDSSVLVAYLAQRARVLPLYVSVGFAWEVQEQAALARLAGTRPFQDRVRPPVTLHFDMRDVHPAHHWAITGTPPAFDTPDEDVYIPGRNIVLLTKAALTAATRQISHLALGPLAGNPFPDATPQFFESLAVALSLGLNHPIAIAAPFASLSKAAVIHLGMTLGVDLGLTLSCMNPRDGRHCGRCSKCRERRDAFHEAGLTDPTAYASTPVR